MSARRSLVPAALALGVALVAAGCDKSSVDTVDPTSAPASSTPTAAATTTAAAPSTATSAASPSTRTVADPAPATGQCMLKEPDWTKISCTAAHQYEVSAVVADSSFPGDLLKRYEVRSATCERKASEYLGSGAVQATHYRSITYPIAKDPQAASRFICLVGSFDAGFDKVGVLTGSAKGKLAVPGAVYTSRACVAQPIVPTASTAPAVCSAKHAAEAVGAAFIGQPRDAFPGTAEVAKRTSAACTPAYNAFIGKITKPRTDISMVTIPPNPTSWAKGVRRSSCFVQVKSGQVTKSLKGIGDKPLASYQ